MKWFTEPNGKFVIKVPIEWQYKNRVAGFKEESPFSFEHYEQSNWSFQISCYSNQEKTPNKNFPVQKADTSKLDFFKRKMDDDKFKIYLWGCNVEDHFFVIKYITDQPRPDKKQLKQELERVEKILSTLQLISPEKRLLAMNLDKYENFMASLAASFDLRNKALENVSLIELTIIIANQIDAFLRMSIVLKKQIDENSDDFDVKYLFQSTTDSPIMERTIYKESHKSGIIDDTVFNELESLYQERNKIVHRYIISDFKTIEMVNITLRYIEVCEIVRLKLKSIEDIQIEKNIGIFKNKKVLDDVPEEYKRILYSQVNDKHHLENFKRKL